MNNNEYKNGSSKISSKCKTPCFQNYFMGKPNQFIIFKYGIGTHNERDTNCLLLFAHMHISIRFFDQKPVEDLEIF